MPLYVVSTFLVCRKSELQGLVDTVDVQVQELRQTVEGYKVKADEAAHQHRTCITLIQQLRETMNESGDENVANVLGTVLNGHCRKLDGFKTTENDMDQKLQQALKKLSGLEARLYALREHLQDISKGGGGVALRPHPLLNNLEGGLLESSSIFFQDPECSICAKPFPFADLLFCSCHHVYHPWCAAEWFKANYVCAVANCGTVHPSWYKSWGFGDYDILAKKATGIHGNFPTTVGTGYPHQGLWKAPTGFGMVVFLIFTVLAYYLVFSFTSFPCSFSSNWKFWVS
jgi:hypothetical protein